MKQMIMGKINNHSTSCDVRIVYILNYVKKKINGNLMIFNLFIFYDAKGKILRIT